MSLPYWCTAVPRCGAHLWASLGKDMVCWAGSVECCLPGGVFPFKVGPVPSLGTAGDGPWLTCCVILGSWYRAGAGILTQRDGMKAETSVLSVSLHVPFSVTMPDRSCATGALSTGCSQHQHLPRCSAAQSLQLVAGVHLFRSMLSKVS